jgi:hypothetical protein
MNPSNTHEITNEWTGILAQRLISVSGSFLQVLLRLGRQRAMAHRSIARLEADYFAKNTNYLAQTKLTQQSHEPNTKQESSTCSS